MNDLSKIPGIGKMTVKKMNDNLIFSPMDIINHYPAKYDEYVIQPLRDAIHDQRVCFLGMITKTPVVQYIRKNFTRLTFQMEVDNELIKATLFNRDFLRNKLTPGTEVVVIGKYDKMKKSVTATSLKFKENFCEGIFPKYNIEGITDKKFLDYVNTAIDMYIDLFEEDLPKELIDKYRLITVEELIYNIHNPKSNDDLIEVNRRIKYEELLKFQLKLQYLKKRNKEKNTEIIRYDNNMVKEFIKTLPFDLTSDQKTATNDICRDLLLPYPMNRLIQGDVGSGKTVVCAIAIYAVITASFQAVLMAPTEVLAEQHYLTFQNYFKDFDVTIGYLSSKIKGNERKIVLEKLASGEIDFIIGTHALIQDTVLFHRLGFVITDEQHRFGVNQRKKLHEKAVVDNLLYLSATPIPRTLAISVFGDMDISKIQMLPKGRKEIKTKIYNENHLDYIVKKIEEEIEKKHQIYIVTPIIDESEMLEVRDVYQTYEFFQHHFSGTCNVGIMHGKLKSDEKQSVMEKFVNGSISILVSTTVIEVGVDVGNATMIVIFNSERFGLSQLHQLRGRVGRSNLQSFCLLVSDYDVERLQLMEETNDGFILSEHDLRLRGPGDFFGYKQSGIPSFKRANLVEDYHIMEIAKKDADMIIDSNKLFDDKEYVNLYRYLRKKIDKKSMN